MLVIYKYVTIIYPESYCYMVIDILSPPRVRSTTQILFL